MIPKIIHYCWLSQDKKPESVRKCIASWHRQLPDYQFKLWDINSFDFDSVPFTRDALANKKWAFVSDYIRLYALYNYGGVYLDSDVQCFDRIDDFLENRLFTGLEMRDKEHTQIFIEAAIIGSEKKHPFIKEALDYYGQRVFLNESGNMDLTPIPTILSDLLIKKYSWERKDETQSLPDGIKVYSTEFIANSNCKRKLSVRLYHLNNRSWIPTTFYQNCLRKIKQICRNWL